MHTGKLLFAQLMEHLSMTAETPTDLPNAVPEARDVHAHPIPVFYSEELNAQSESYSPSAAKPQLVVAAWQVEKFPLQFGRIQPVTETDLCLAHDPAYVRGVLTCQLPNGFSNTSPEVAQSLPWTSGAMLSAARKALTTGIACAPVSGFHHAHYDFGSGFCTFNGLVITALKLLAEGQVRRVLILDCDQHFGDGTDDILLKLSAFDTVSNASLGRLYRRSRDAKAYLGKLRQLVGSFNTYGLVLYQAGADVHVEDPLGGVLTTEQMIERDRIVFEAARMSGVPLVWNLAGGYQDPVAKVVALHVNTMFQCVRVYSAPRQTAAGGLR